MQGHTPLSSPGSCWFSQLSPVDWWRGSGHHSFVETLQLPADLPTTRSWQLKTPHHASLLIMRRFHSRKKNLMRPFPGRNLPRECRIFNYRLSRARLVEQDGKRTHFWKWKMFWRLPAFYCFVLWIISLIKVAYIVIYISIFSIGGEIKF